jgi:hypothetical protein
VARAQALDLVITDDGLDAMAIEEFRQAGVKLVVAEPLPFEVDGSAD